MIYIYIYIISISLSLYLSLSIYTCIYIYIYIHIPCRSGENATVGRRAFRVPNWGLKSSFLLLLWKAKARTKGQCFSPADTGNDACGNWHRLNRYLAQRVPSLFITNSFRT